MKLSQLNEVTNSSYQYLQDAENAERIGDLKKALKFLDAAMRATSNRYTKQLIDYEIGRVKKLMKSL